MVGAACSLPVGTAVATVRRSVPGGSLTGQHGLWRTSKLRLRAVDADDAWSWTPAGQTLTATMGNGEAAPLHPRRPWPRRRARRRARRQPSPTPSPSPSAAALASQNPTAWSVVGASPPGHRSLSRSALPTAPTASPPPRPQPSRAPPALCPPGRSWRPSRALAASYSGQQAIFDPTCQFAEVGPLTGSRDSGGAITVVYPGNPGSPRPGPGRRGGGAVASSATPSPPPLMSTSTW